MGYLHDSHDHALVICKKADCGGDNCQGCGDACSGTIYGCDGCKFFVHYSCLVLPREISHPNHPDHRLTLNDIISSFHCSSCSLPHDGFSFRCSHCDFSLDVRCAFPFPIKHKFHPHRFSFFKEWMGRPTSCNFCGEPCESLVLYCLECQFAIHLLCGPLPISICCSYCHQDRLTLTPSLEGDEDDSDDEGFYAYCDECEEEVELGSRAYICGECGALAHLTCVVDQVLILLKRGRAVELTGLSAEAAQDGQKGEEERVETLQDIVDSFNNIEKKDLDKIRKRKVAEIVRVLAFRNNMKSSSSHSPFLDEVFAEFLERLNDLDFQPEDPLALNEGCEGVEAVGEYKVSWKLAPVLEDIFANYGDVSAQSNLASESKVKTCVFVILCRTIDSMLKTKVDGITERLLYRWWRDLIFVYSSGFNVTFAINRLKIVMRAHYSLQDKSNTAAKLDKKIAGLRDEIGELKQKLEEKEGKFRRKKEKRGEMDQSPADDDLQEAYSSRALAWKWPL